MTCTECGGAGILLDFDTSTYDFCPCTVKAGEMVTLPTPASKPFPKCRVVGFTVNKLKVGK